MKILVTSDTHGSTTPLMRLITEYSERVQVVFHLGDYSKDLTNLAAGFPHLRFEAVAGVADFGEAREKIINFNGCDILLVHGHLNFVKNDINKIINYAVEKNVNACLFGHTHFQEIFEKQGILFMNPGSIVEPRGGSKAGYGLLDISEDGKISGEIIST